MKKSILFLFLTAASISSFASQIKCEIEATVVGKAGLMMHEEKIFWQTDLQEESYSLKISKCSKYSVSASEEVMLCANKTNAVGVYEVNAVIHKDEELLGGMRSLVGTSIKSPSNLIDLDSSTVVLHSFQSKISALGLTAPSAYSGDSLLLDETIVQANKISKNSLVGTLVTLQMTNCQLNK